MDLTNDWISGLDHWMGVSKHSTTGNENVLNFADIQPSIALRPIKTTVTGLKARIVHTNGPAGSMHGWHGLFL